MKLHYDFCNFLFKCYSGYSDLAVRASSQCFIHCLTLGEWSPVPSSAFGCRPLYFSFTQLENWIFNYYYFAIIIIKMIHTKIKSGHISKFNTVLELKLEILVLFLGIYFMMHLLLRYNLKWQFNLTYIFWNEVMLLLAMRVNFYVARAHRHE